VDQNFYKSLLDNLYDGVYFVDRERRITYWNRGAERITGYSEAEVVGHRCMDNLLAHVDLEGCALCTGACPLARTMADRTSRETEVFLHHRDGHRVPVLVRTAPIFGSDGGVTGAVEIFTEHTSRVAALEQVKVLERLAYLDPLTELPNRRFAEMGLDAALNELNRFGWPFGVLMMDLDRFKEINDGFGHEAGDRVLRMTARTLASASRSFDLVGRWGGEEFLAVVKNVPPAGLRAAGEKFRFLVESSNLEVAGRRVSVTLSVGAASALPGETAGELVKRADGALYASKKAGRNRVTLALESPSAERTGS